MGRYVRAKGDLVAPTFRPDHVHEQHGRFPALVVSNDPFQKASGLRVVCPITPTDRQHPFHVPIPEGNDRCLGSGRPAPRFVRAAPLAHRHVRPFQMLAWIFQAPSSTFHTFRYLPRSTTSSGP